MRYLFGVVLPALLQVLVVFIIIETNTGNGSWLGLLAYLIGLFAIPLTAIINALYIWKSPTEYFLGIIGKCFAIALIAPVMCVFMLFL